MPDSGFQHALACEDLTRFLAVCYYQPTIDFVQERLFESLNSAASLVDAELADCAKRLGDDFAGLDIVELTVDYTRLFLGPPSPRVKPYASSWLPSKSRTGEEDPNPLVVIEFYRQGGFDVDERFQDLPDHVAVELEFLYLLTFRRNRAQHDHDIESMNRAASLRDRFLNEHLLRWIVPFSEAVTNEAESSFYRELGMFTRRYVQTCLQSQTEIA